MQMVIVVMLSCMHEVIVLLLLCMVCGVRCEVHCSQQYTTGYVIDWQPTPPACNFGNHAKISLIFSYKHMGDDLYQTLVLSLSSWLLVNCTVYMYADF